MGRSVGLSAGEHLSPAKMMERPPVFYAFVEFYFPIDVIALRTIVFGRITLNMRVFIYNYLSLHYRWLMVCFATYFRIVFTA